MSKRIYGSEYGLKTRAVHTGNDVDSETGAIKCPITMTNNYELTYDPSDLNWSSAGKNLYAQKVAEYLETVKGVSFVASPGLKNHKGHDIAKSQMSPGFGGVLSFGLNADHDTHNRFVSHLNVITSAVSLGHDESQIVFLGENDERQYLYP